MNTKTIIRLTIWFMVFNSLFTVIWFAMIPISIQTGLKDSVPYLVMVSLWANFVGHLSGVVAGLVAIYEYKSNKES